MSEKNKNENNKVLIIYAHPHKEGHNGLILKNVINELKDKNQDYELIDLYEIKFNPALSKEELFKKNEEKNADIIDLQKKILETNKMIFIFPVWWNNVPAILKGFFDRVFSSGFAFKYVKVLPNFSAPKPLLKGKKASIIMTTGAPKILYWIFQGGRASKLIGKDTLKFCGIKTKIFHYGSARKINEKTQIKLSNLTKKATKWVLK